jgi:DNA-binding beta-propeller fold protein YncE
MVMVQIAPDTGNRTVLSGCTTFDPDTSLCTTSIGTGPPLDYPADIAVDRDGSLVVADGSGAVVRVAPDTGNRTVLSGCTAFDPWPFSCTASIGTGPPLDYPADIAVAPDGSLVVVDSGNVVWVNPVTGERTSVSGFDREANMTIGKGPLFVNPDGIAVEADGSLIVVDTSLGAVVRVDPPTGDRTLISR